MPVGDTIRKARYRSGYSLRALAGLLKIAPAYLSDIETGRRTPTERVLRGVSAKLDVDFDLLMRQAGRLQETARQYILREELAGRIVQRMAEAKLEREDLEMILQIVEDTATKRVARRNTESTENYA